jgi:Uma2 family endonuclease
MPSDFRAELLDGVVYVSSPARYEHGQQDSSLGLALAVYASGTPGVEAASNVTVILDEENEPQPDQLLRVAEALGGQSHINAEGYVRGAPELLAETAYSSRDVDLGVKKQEYQLAGVLEYLVVCLRPEELYWFRLNSRRQIRPDAKGIFRSQVFPGLWVDGSALLQRDSARLRKVVEEGLASPEHARFVRRLQAAKRRGNAF